MSFEDDLLDDLDAHSGGFGDGYDDDYTIDESVTIEGPEEDEYY